MAADEPEEHSAQAKLRDPPIKQEIKGRATWQRFIITYRHPRARSNSASWQCKHTHTLAIILPSEAKSKKVGEHF
jgi:hypothetical protein